jgi:hypothetical protein
LGGLPKQILSQAAGAYVSALQVSHQRAGGRTHVNVFLTGRIKDQSESENLLNFNALFQNFRKITVTQAQHYYPELSQGFACAGTAQG